MNRIAALILGAAAIAIAAPALAETPEQTLAAAQKRLAQIDYRAGVQQDIRDIENLQRIYGYYLDRNQWDQIADLFADDGTIEIAQRGVYVGKKRIRQSMELFGPPGVHDGYINDHMQLQIIVTVAPDRKTAKARNRGFLMMADVAKGESRWSEGTYENTYVRQNGVWKIKALKFHYNMSTPYDQGWGKAAVPVPTASKTLPPDRPPTSTYASYPKATLEPFHYPNPVTGKPTQYSGSIDKAQPKPIALSAPVAPPAGGRAADASGAKTVAALKAKIAETRLKIDRVNDYDSIENLQDAYGYYLDKNLWDQLADLFAKDGSRIELAQRGYYVGQDHIRAFLHDFGGKEGPRENGLGDHLQVQPVIHVSADGKTARIRSRMLQMMGSAGARASWGGAIYENEYVKLDGVWQIKDDHAYNTFTAPYDGGPLKSTGGLPGKSKRLPPDGEPSMKLEAFPRVLDLPIHYKNPVTGRE